MQYRISYTPPSWTVKCLVNLDAVKIVVHGTGERQRYAIDVQAGARFSSDQMWMIQSLIQDSMDFATSATESQIVYIIKPGR